MLNRILVCAGAILLLSSGTVHAQLSQYNHPIESGTLETHVDLQLQYSKLDILSTDLNVALLSLEGQLALGRFELALDVPFVVHGWATSLDSTAFGDIMAGFKVRLFGLGDKFGVSLFTNLWLPTHSGDFHREYVQLQSGAVASLHVIGFHFGAGLQTYWTIIGHDTTDVGLLGLYGYARFPILGIIALQAALEYFNSVHPNAEVNAFLITPSVEVSVAWFHAGIGARIAVTDEARPVNLGRAALIANAGLRF
jgi:hypothetical protein